MMTGLFVDNSFPLEILAELLNPDETYCISGKGHLDKKIISYLRDKDFDVRKYYEDTESLRTFHIDDFINSIDRITVCHTGVWNTSITGVTRPLVSLYYKCRRIKKDIEVTKITPRKHYEETTTTTSRP